ncbi:MAG: IS110 family transposase [Acidimicrobiia bacterium]
MDTVTTMGCDPHLDTISAAVVDEIGRELGAVTVPNTLTGWARLAELATEFQVVTVGIEGASGYGVSLTRILDGLGFEVREIPTRLTAERRKAEGRSKTDPGDARAIARAAAAGEGHRWADTPDSEIIRILTVRREQLVTQQTADINQLRAFVTELDPDRSATASRLRTVRGLRRFTQFDAEDPTGFDQALLELIGQIVETCIVRIGEIKALEERMQEALPPVGHALVERFFGCGLVTACQIIAETAGIDGFATDAKFAAWSGAAPLDASSGRQQFHRLNRGGNRQVNRALHTIVVTQLRNGGDAADFASRHNPENKDALRKRTIRAAKRHVARQVWKTFRDHGLT